MKVKDAMKGMTGKEKVEYIWEYFKIHIIVTICVIAAITSFVIEINTNPQYVFNLTMLGQYQDMTKSADFEKEVTKALLGENSGRKQAQVDFYPLTTSAQTGQLELQYEYTQKFMVMLATSSLDAMILDEASFNSVCKDNGLLRLDTVSGIDLKGLKTVEASNEKQGKGIYGIKVDDLKKLKDIQFDSEGKILCIASNSKHVDNAVKFLKWITQ